MFLCGHSDARENKTISLNFDALFIILELIRYKSPNLVTVSHFDLFVYRIFQLTVIDKEYVAVGTLLKFFLLDGTVG